MEEINFRAFVHSSSGFEVNKMRYESPHTIFEWEREGVAMDIMQFTGIKDENGRKIYEGDIVRRRIIYRETQTHTGDNIPNGSYTEPMEPLILTSEEVVKFQDGIFGFDKEDTKFDYGIDFIPLAWIANDLSEEDVRSEISYYGFEWSGSDGDLQYLLGKYECENIEELLKYINTFEVIGNIYENPEL